MLRQPRRNAGDVVHQQHHDHHQGEERKRLAGDPADIALIGATVNAAGSFAQSINTAYIAGSGSISADSVSVKAKTVSESKAIARKNFTVGLLTIGSLSAIATTGDSVSATVSGVDLEATSGDVTVVAIGSTNAYALC